MKCIEPDQIAAVLKLPADDPLRRHLEECPRCASRLLLYRRFLSGDRASGADTADADARLEAVMREAIYGSPSARPAAYRTRFSRFADAITSRPARAAAAVLIVVAVAAWLRPWSTDRSVLRNGDETGAGVHAISLLPPQIRDDGAVRLSWQTFDKADSYIIRVRSLDLEEIARFGPFADTTFVLRRPMLPPETASSIHWRVIALRNGDEIGRSGPASLELPAKPAE